MLAITFVFLAALLGPAADAKSALRSHSAGASQQVALREARNSSNSSSSSSSNSSTSSSQEQPSAFNEAALNANAAPVDKSLYNLSDAMANGLVDGQVTAQYWQTVDHKIAVAGLVTPKPKSVNDPKPTPKPEPYSKILGASEKVVVEDTPELAAEGADENYELATPKPLIESPSENEKNVRTVGVLPYQMLLGAKLLQDMSEKNTPSPLPSQAFVDETFNAQCPMIMMSNDIFVSPPCNGGDENGAWSDLSSDRIITRWKPNGKGGLSYKVDSAVTGPGSVDFASLNEKLTMDETVFELYNCVGVLRYTVQETIVKVEHMAQNAQSTGVAHDVGQASNAIFYQYLIKHPNGSVAAQSSQYRLPETEVNFTTVIPGQLSQPLLAAAKREGHWGGSSWRECKLPQAGWKISFPTEKGKNLVSIATVQDLQVAATAVLTLLAYREEQVGSDGFEHAGEMDLYLSMFKTFLWIALVIFLLSVCVLVSQKLKLETRLKKVLIRLEAIVMPKCPHNVREPPLKASW